MLDKMALEEIFPREEKFQGITAKRRSVGQVRNYSTFRLRADDFLFARYLLVKNQRAVLFDQFMLKKIPRFDTWTERPST